MQTYAVYFHPRGGLASTISSDTLFGAVCWGIQILGLKDDVGAWLASSQSPPFAFSAPFPVWFSREKEPLLNFYPRPANFDLRPDRIKTLIEARSEASGKDPKSISLQFAGAIKSFRMVQYFSEGVMARTAKGSYKPDDLLLEQPQDIPAIKQAGRFLYLKSEWDTLRKTGIPSIENFNVMAEVQHNSVDRMAGSTGEGLLFYDDVTFFSQRAGYWALVRTDAQIFSDLIEPALRYLADTGLGANRSTGYGAFDITVRPMPVLPEAPKPNAILMLSRFLAHPADEIDFDGSPLAYQVTTLRPKRESIFSKPVEGQRTQPVYKGAVRMFEPGSVFPLKRKQEIFGRLAEVVSGENGGPVYQSGAAIPLFINVEEGL